MQSPQAYDPGTKPNHAYGQPLVRDAYGVGACTSSWDVSKGTSRKEAPMDYQRINKLIVHEGI
jgi:hypothetical protein